jgi:hypothetical protein
MTELSEISDLPKNPTFVLLYINILIPQKNGTGSTLPLSECARDAHEAHRPRRPIADDAMRQIVFERHIDIGPRAQVQLSPLDDGASRRGERGPHVVVAVAVVAVAVNSGRYRPRRYFPHLRRRDGIGIPRRRGCRRGGGGGGDGGGENDRLDER